MCLRVKALGTKKQRNLSLDFEFEDRIKIVTEWKLNTSVTLNHISADSSLTTALCLWRKRLYVIQEILVQILLLEEKDCEE